MIYINDLKKAILLFHIIFSSNSFHTRSCWLNNSHKGFIDMHAASALLVDPWDGTQITAVCICV